MSRPNCSQCRPLPIPFVPNDNRLWLSVVITAICLSGLLILPLLQSL
jgi:hypothetical protein